MRHFFLVNRYLVLLFAVASGLFKVVGGQADVVVFAHVGLSVGAVAAFGLVQALAGLAVASATTRRAGAVLVTGCNTFATSVLFVAGIQPFGALSILFVVMAFLEIFDERPTTYRLTARTPAHS